MGSEDDQQQQREIAGAGPELAQILQARRRQVEAVRQQSWPSTPRRSRTGAVREPASLPDDFDGIFGAHGLLSRIGEKIPFVNSGIQRLHDINGSKEALQRARQDDPIGPDGYLTQAAEHIPVVNYVVQGAHRASGYGDALKRAHERNPIGTDGYITQVVEHVPGFSDGVVALHRLSGEEMAAERARSHTLRKLLSKDGTFTRMAELLPMANLLAAAMHGLLGNHDEALRALDLFDNWYHVLEPDGPVAQMAELLPGADAIAFAVHLQIGNYAQALRSLTKTSWAQVAAESVDLQIRVASLRELTALSIELGPAGFEVLPRQASLVVGMSDLLADFLWMYHKRHGSKCGQLQAASSPNFSPQNDPAQHLTKELLKAIIDDRLRRCVGELQGNVPGVATSFKALLSRRLLTLRRRSLFRRLAVPPRPLPSCTPCLIEEIQRALPDVTFSHGPLPAVEKVALRRRGAQLPRIAAAGSCCAFLSCASLGLKAAPVACAAGLLAGVVELGRSAARRAAAMLDAYNAEAWISAVRTPQPAPMLVKKTVEADSVEPEGVVVELDRGSVRSLALLTRSYYAEDILGVSPWRSWLLWAAAPMFRRLARVTLETRNGAVVPFVIELELEEWEIELEDCSFNLAVPAVRFAVILHLALDGGSPRCVRAFAALPDDLVQAVSQKLQDQISEWDLRELDKRFRGFTHPIHLDMQLQIQWPAKDIMQVQARSLSTRLDLPD